MRIFLNFPKLAFAVSLIVFFAGIEGIGGVKDKVKDKVLNSKQAEHFTKAFESMKISHIKSQAQKSDAFMKFFAEEAILDKVTSEKFEEWRAAQEKIIKDNLQMTLEEKEMAIAALDEAIESHAKKYDAVIKSFAEQAALDKVTAEKLEEWRAAQEKIIKDNVQKTIEEKEMEIEALRVAIEGQIKKNIDDAAAAGKSIFSSIGSFFSNIGSAVKTAGLTAAKFVIEGGMKLYPPLFIVDGVIEVINNITGKAIPKLFDIVKKFTSKIDEQIANLKPKKTEIKELEKVEEKEQIIPAVEPAPQEEKKIDIADDFKKDDEKDDESEEVISYEQQLYESAIHAFRSDKYSSAITIFKKYLAEFPSNPRTENVLYRIGDSYYELKQYDTAISYYNKVLSNNFYGRDQAAAMKIGYSYFWLKNYDSAAKGFQRYIDNYPRGKHIDRAKQWKEICINEAGYRDNKTNTDIVQVEDTSNTVWGGRYKKPGELGPAGGFVFYDKGHYSGGWRYLEAAPVETEFIKVQWGGRREKSTGAGTVVGKGKSNTELIVDEQDGYFFGLFFAEKGRAAQLCANLKFGGKDDWFLPSKDELNWMYKNLKLQGIGDFSGWYWSSTQDNDGYAWYQDFDFGFQHSTYYKYNPFSVRAVRRF